MADILCLIIDPSQTTEAMRDQLKH